VKNVVGAGGVSKDEAKQWHYRIYGGQIDLRAASPLELGAAAAYEAYRSWKHNSSLYEPLSGDRDRQREALIGLAIGESERLWQTTGRMDGYGVKETSEEAASTASRIWTYMIHHQREAYNRTPYGSRPSSPYRSSSPYRAPSPYRSSSPYRSPSPYRSSSPFQGGGGYGASGYGPSYGDGYGGQTLHRSPSMTGLNGGTALAQPSPMLPGYQGAYTTANYLNTSPSMAYARPITPPISYAQPAYGQSVAPYGGAYGVQQPYADPYGAQQGVQYVNGQAVPAGSTIIIDAGSHGSHHRSRRHSHSSSHSHRRRNSASSNHHHY